jgi:hypothetical protein
MDLYVCYGTFGAADHHACAKAHKALIAVGHSPTVIRTYGCYGTDRFFGGRRKIKDLTGTYKVPTLILDDGSIIDGSDSIVAWASSDPD